MKRWTSRKFLMALAAQLGGLAVLIWPSRAAEVAGLIESLAALLVAAMSALGYIAVEGAIDKARVASGPPSGGEPNGEGRGGEAAGDDAAFGKG